MDSSAADRAPGEDGERTAEAQAPRKRGRPFGDREARIGEIVAAAREVIAEEGYARASLRKVAERAGISTGPLTYNFANKEAMIEAVAESLFDEFEGWIVEGEGGGGLRTVLQQMLTWATSGDKVAVRVLLQLVAPAAAEPALGRIVRDRYAALRAGLETLIEKEQARGALRTDLSARALSEQISAITDGWIMVLSFEPERFAPERQEALIDEVMRLVAASDRAR